MHDGWRRGAGWTPEDGGPGGYRRGRVSNPDGRSRRGASSAAATVMPGSRPAPAARSNSRGRPLPTGANPCRPRSRNWPCRPDRKPPDGAATIAGIPWIAAIACLHGPSSSRQLPPVEAAVVAVRTHGARDQVIGDVLEVDLELGVQHAELQPDLPVEVPFAGVHHDRRPVLPRIPVRMHAVLAADRDEQPDRPQCRAARTSARPRVRDPRPDRPGGLAAGPSRPRRRHAPPDRRPRGTALPPWRVSP